MTIAVQNKVERILYTDEGFVFLYNEDFAEGGTRDEAIFNMLRRVAIVNKSVRQSKKMPVKEFKVLNRMINLN